MEANGVITSIHPRWQQRRKEGRKGHSTAIHQFKDHFRCRGGVGGGERGGGRRNSQREAKLELPSTGHCSDFCIIVRESGTTFADQTLKRNIVLQPAPGLTEPVALIKVHVYLFLENKGQAWNKTSLGDIKGHN